MKVVAVVCLLSAVALAGCASSRSILYSGVSGPLGGNKRVVTDAMARDAARNDQTRWLEDIGEQARSDRGSRFANLSAAEFRRRLDAAATKYGFTVKTVRFLHPRQVAPLVVAQTRDYLAFSKAIPAIERSLDPGRAHPAFEAFYLQGDDERGIPFVIAFDEFRGERMGGQWARSDALYPFVHL